MGVFAWLLFLTGCGSPQIWYQPGKTAADAHRDLGACKMEAARTVDPHGISMIGGLGGFMAASAGRGQFETSCMMEKGYMPTPAKQIPQGQNYPRK